MATPRQRRRVLFTVVGVLTGSALLGAHVAVISSTGSLPWVRALCTALLVTVDLYWASVAWRGRGVLAHRLASLRGSHPERSDQDGLAMWRAGRRALDRIVTRRARDAF